MTALIDPFSKDFWIKYVTTAQDEAAQYLGATPEPQLRQDAIDNGRISTRYRPIAFTYIDNSWNWDWSTRHYFQAQPTQPAQAKTKEQENKEKANTAIKVGIVFFLSAAFFVGYSLKLLSNQRNTNHFRVQVAQSLKNAIQNLPDVEVPRKISRQNLGADLKDLINEQREIDIINTHKIRNYFLASLGTLIGGGLLIGGGFAIIPIMMTAGYVTLIASGALALGNLAMHWNDRQELTLHYRAIAGKHAIAGKNDGYNGLAEEILRSMAGLPERLSTTTNPPPAYARFSSVPPLLYPDLYEPNNPTWEPSAPPIQPPSYEEATQSH